MAQPLCRVSSSVIRFAADVFCSVPGGVVEGSIIALIGTAGSSRVGNVVPLRQRDPRLIVVPPQSQEHAHAEYHWNRH
jgi:hypothetical protein